MRCTIILELASNGLLMNKGRHQKHEQVRAPQKMLPHWPLAIGPLPWCWGYFAQVKHKSHGHLTHIFYKDLHVCLFDNRMIAIQIINMEKYYLIILASVRIVRNLFR
jgi:hypothetical protein